MVCKEGSVTPRSRRFSSGLVRIAELHPTSLNPKPPLKGRHQRRFTLPALSELQSGDDVFTPNDSNVLEYSYVSSFQIGHYRSDNSLEEEKFTVPSKVNSHYRRTSRMSNAEHDVVNIGRNRIDDQFTGFSSNCMWIAVDWTLLAAFGVTMALLSMLVDYGVHKLQNAQSLLHSVSGSILDEQWAFVIRFLTWAGYMELLLAVAVVIVRHTAPQAAGSGLPEMKTMLRGAILTNYLSLRALVAKFAGLILVLGAGLPVSKMGPFVHISAIIADKFSNLASKFSRSYDNEGHRLEMLAVASAVGVACTFSAPIGGVLFSIEVTTAYFRVRNYWRGVFAAVCGATVFRLMHVGLLSTKALGGFYQTTFPKYCWQSHELFAFALLGLVSGLIGTSYVTFYEAVANATRHNALFKRFLNKHWLVHPSLITFLVAFATFPSGFGHLISGRYTFAESVGYLFSNCTWSTAKSNATQLCSTPVPDLWRLSEEYAGHSVLLMLALFVTTFFVLAALCNTMPIPCGTFMPTFVVGAALGRLVGETVAWMPSTLYNAADVVPGVYAVAGAAALTGSVTHTVSVVMICCEITGQMVHVVPVIVSVIVSNAIAAFLRPSIYDCIIRLKRLPYLPELGTSRLVKQDRSQQSLHDEGHAITAKDIMSQVRHLGRATTYDGIRRVLEDRSMMLIGSVTRTVLQTLLNASVGRFHSKNESEVVLDESLIDPAPMQLVPGVGINKIHSLFSLLDLRRAYVTENGRLVGVVTLRDVGKLP